MPQVQWKEIQIFIKFQEVEFGKVNIQKKVLLKPAYSKNSPTAPFRENSSWLS
jgi:hypothetical protein